MSHRKVALVTGSARRIGAAIVERLAVAGYDVAVHHRKSEADAEATAAAARAHGVDAHVFAADLLDDAQVLGLAAAVEERFGRVDVLVHNASIFHRTPFSETSLPDFADQLDRFHRVHVRAPLLLTRCLVEGMQARGWGRIVALADVSLRAPRARYAPYVASKAALVAACQSLSRELAPQITVNLIAPGVILPPETPDAGPSVAGLLKRVPAGRLGKPAEIADAVLFFVDGPDFVTGQTLEVAGGE